MYQPTMFIVRTKNAIFKLSLKSELECIWFAIVSLRYTITDEKLNEQMNHINVLSPLTYSSENELQKKLIRVRSISSHYIGPSSYSKLQPVKTLKTFVGSVQFIFSVIFTEQQHIFFIISSRCHPVLNISIH